MRLPFFLARRFVAGETLDETLPRVSDLHERGLYVSVDLLGENVEERRPAEEARDAYIELVQRITGGYQDFKEQTSISIKLSMMGQKIDGEFCLENLRALLEVAREHDVFVRLDMEGSDVTESTLSLFETVYSDFPAHVGIVLQAYLKRTPKDVRRMCDLGASVRLCKGAYKESTDIAYGDMATIRLQFIECMKTLLTRGRYPGIATHDDELISATKVFAGENGIKPEDFEFQMLYGMRTETQQEIVRDGYRMRIYVPYGSEWFPYFRRRMMERKENVFFVIKNILRR